MPPALRRALVIVLAAVVLGVAVGCSDDDGPSGPTTTARATTTTVPNVARTLTPPPFKGRTSVLIGASKDQVVAFGGANDAEAAAGRFQPYADGAIGSGSPLRWKRMAKSPATFANADIGFVTGGVVVAGVPCEAMDVPDETEPSCDPGGVAASRWDEKQDRWTDLGSPEGFGPGQQDGMPTAVLIGTTGADAYFRIDSPATESVWVLDTAADPGTGWARVPDPPVTPLRYCVADGSLVVGSVSATGRRRGATGPQVHRFTNGEWQAARLHPTPPAPVPNTFTSCAGDRIAFSNSAPDPDHVTVYDAAANSWKTIDSLRDDQQLEVTASPAGDLLLVSPASAAIVDRSTGKRRKVVRGQVGPSVVRYLPFADGVLYEQPGTDVVTLQYVPLGS